MKLGSKDISNIYLGSKEIDKIYLGSKEIFSSEIAPNGSPSELVATVLSDTSIKLDWTNGATNQDGTYIYTSLDGVTNWVLSATASGIITTKNLTGLTENTTYYVKVAHYKGNKLSEYSNIASQKLYLLVADLTGEVIDVAGIKYLKDSKNSNHFRIVNSGCKKTGTVTLPTGVDSTINSKNFAVGFWIYGSYVNSDAKMCTNYASSRGFFISFNRFSKTTVFVSGDTGNTNFQEFANIPENTWTYVKVVFTSNSATGIEVFFNGVSQGAKGDMRNVGNITSANRVAIPGTTTIYQCGYTIYDGSNNIIADYPMAECWPNGVTKIIYDRSGNNYHASEIGGVYLAVKQNVYHSNKINGCTKVINGADITRFFFIPYKVDGTPIYDAAYKLANGTFYALEETKEFPAGNYWPDIESKFNAPASLESIDANNYLFTSGHVAQDLSYDNTIYNINNQFFRDVSVIGKNTDLKFYAEPLTGAHLNYALTSKVDYEIFVEWGQSQMAGTNSLFTVLKTDFPADYVAPLFDARIWNGSKLLVLDANYKNYCYPGGNNGFCVEHYIAINRPTRYKKCLFLKYAVGGTKLYKDGAVTDWNIHSTGEYYDLLKTEITNMLNYLSNNKINYTIKGIIQYIGTEDSRTTAARDAYKQNNIDFINGLRTFLGSNSIPYYIIQNSSNFAPATYVVNNIANAPYGIMQLQQQIVSEQSNCYLIDTSTDVVYESDTVHPTTAGMRKISQNFMNVLLD